MKALALVSGGLDSILAAVVVKELGIEVVGLYFNPPFYLRRKKDTNSAQDFAWQLTQRCGIELRIVRMDEQFLRIAKSPVHGYGANMNPCIDCRILMLQKAKEFMAQEQASFIVTGEVLGQRPMSQHKKSLYKIDKEAGLEGLVVRPLSAKLLDVTIPEKDSWIKREALFDFNGRGRRQQIDLAVMHNIVDYPNPAGGCLLTDPQFSQRLRDILRYGPYDINTVNLLKLGRHYRLSPTALLIVGRNEQENQDILELARDNDYVFSPPEDMAGPIALFRGELTVELLDLTGQVLARYCDKLGQDKIAIDYYRLPDKTVMQVSAVALAQPELEKLRI